MTGKDKPEKGKVPGKEQSFKIPGKESYSKTPGKESTKGTPSGKSKSSASSTVSSGQRKFELRVSKTWPERTFCPWNRALLLAQIHIVMMDCPYPQQV